MQNYCMDTKAVLLAAFVSVPRLDNETGLFVVNQQQIVHRFMHTLQNN